MKKPPVSKLQFFICRANLYIENLILFIYLALKRFDAVRSDSIILRTIRFDKLSPIGLLMFPVLWITVICSKSIPQFLLYSLLFLFGAIYTRSAGVIINDVLDRDLDIKVDRTKERPIASKKISVNNALMLCVIMLLMAFLILAFLPSKSLVAGVITLILMTIYPKMKRFSKYPQIFLGLTYNMGIFIVWFVFEGSVSLTPVLLYIASVLWTVIYDTIYAYQDIRHDKELGIYSMAITLGDKGKVVLIYLAKILIAIIGIVGLYTWQNLLFFIIIYFAYLFLTYEIDNLDQECPKDCAEAFKNQLFFGFMVFLAFAIAQ